MDTWLHFQGRKLSQLFCFTSANEPTTDNPLYTDTRYNDKIRYNDNLTVTKPSLQK